MIGWPTFLLFGDAVEELGLGYLKAWCLPSVSFFCHPLVLLRLHQARSSQCLRACCTIGGGCLGYDIWFEKQPWFCIFNVINVHLLILNYALPWNLSIYFLPQKLPGSLLEGFTQTQMSSLSVKEKLLVAGGLEGELICKVSFIVFCVCLYW